MRLFSTFTTILYMINPFKVLFARIKKKAISKYQIKFFIVGLTWCSAILLFIGCENPITGYGPQPNFIDEHDHKPMLNVFGVLRPEIQYGVPLSFVHLEETISVTSEYPDSFDVVDARVTLYHYQNNLIIDSVKFSYNNFNSVFEENAYRPFNFYPLEQHTYGLSCQKEGYPELTAKTTVPLTPRIIENSLQITDNLLFFSIIPDSLTALYDVYFNIGEREYKSRILRPELGDIQVTINYSRSSEKEGTLIIYAYDLKLSEYFTNTIIIKPNTYQGSISTVENGYGSFGTLNVLEKTINF